MARTWLLQNSAICKSPLSEALYVRWHLLPACYNLFCEVAYTTDSIINRDPNIVGGTAIFAGARVPIKALFDYLEAGDDIDQFLDDFPSVKRDQAVALLELARINLTGLDEAAA